jgi:hypothetical protein
MHGEMCGSVALRILVGQANIVAPVLRATAGRRWCRPAPDLKALNFLVAETSTQARIVPGNLTGSEASHGPRGYQLIAHFSG